MASKFRLDAEYPKSLDNNDPLGHFRERFYVNKEVIYMCGNSLGLACKDAEHKVLETIGKWKEFGIEIWNTDDHKYYLYSRHLAELMAPLVNAHPEEIAVTETTTANIHQCISTLYEPTEQRFKILVDDVNFPTDRYAVDGQVRLKGLDPELAVKVVRARGGFVDERDVIDAMTEDVAMVLLPAVYYRTAQVVDMRAVTRAARERGILVGWDLSHAIGAVEIDFKSLDVDFGVWCTYKYLNGGPGSSAALYMNRRHFQRMPGLPGWFGNRHDTQFLMRQRFEHQPDASGWQMGTPALLSMAALEGSLAVFKEAGIAAVRTKSLHITGYMMYLVENKLHEYGFRIRNPREESRRGGHVCVEHEEAYRISLALKSRGVVPDYRDPNIIRLTPAALYTSYVEVYQVVEALVDIMETKSYKEFGAKRAYVV